MREDEVRKVLIDYLEKNKIEFLQEANLGGCKIDFLIKNDNNWIGVEIKGDRANELLTLGQLLNYYRYISHLMLCASKAFIKKIKNLISTNQELSHLDKKLGTIVIDEGIKFTLPQNSKYYLFITKKQKEQSKYYSKFPKYGILDDIDKSIIELVQNKGQIMLGEIVKLMGFSYESVRKRIRNLEYFGYLKIISKYPTLISIGDINEKGAS